MIRRTFILIGILILFFYSISDGDSFRCGNRIVSKGDSKIEVVSKCGEPDDLETVSYETKGSTFWRGTVDVSTKKVEKMYYNCGEGRFIRILTFIDDKLVSIEEGGYGSGPQRCN